TPATRTNKCAWGSSPATRRRRSRGAPPPCAPPRRRTASHPWWGQCQPVCGASPWKRGRVVGGARSGRGVGPTGGRRRPQRARNEAHEPELRRPGARRGGRPRAREGAGVARPAAGSGRQAQVAGLLVAAALGAGGAGGGCARQGEPPGGPPHTTPPQIVRVVPESGAVVPALKGDAVIQFDEVITEMPSSAGGGGGGGAAEPI